MDEFSLDHSGSWRRYDHLVADATSFGPDRHDMESVQASTILVVEDEWLLRQALCDELRGVGWTVLEAASGERALIILRGGQPIDLLITDIRLDGAMTGWELAKICREADDELPVIYVSANRLEDAQRVEGGVFLSKPCRMEQMLATCHALVTK